MAAIAWRIIPDSPQTAPYLTAREKKVARLRLQPSHPQNNHTTTTTTTTPLRDTLAVLTDPAAWLTALIFLLTNTAYSSLPVFLPTILTAMGHTPLQAQALAAPPYLAAFLLVLATAHASDTTHTRAPFLIAHALASAAGYAVLALADSPALHLAPGSVWRYAAVYPAAAGFFNVVVLTVTWSLNNQRGAGRQGAGFALLQVVGQCGPLVGTRLYPDADAPYYTRGMAVCAGAMLGVAVLAGGLRVWLGRVNARWDREEGVAGGGGVGGGGDGEGVGEEGEALVGGGLEVGGRRERGFRYML